MCDPGDTQAHTLAKTTGDSKDTRNINGEGSEERMMEARKVELEAHKVLMKARL